MSYTDRSHKNLFGDVSKDFAYKDTSHMHTHYERKGANPYRDERPGMVFPPNNPKQKTHVP